MSELAKSINLWRLENDTDRIEMIEHAPKKIANIKLDI